MISIIHKKILYSLLGVFLQLLIGLSVGCIGNDGADTDEAGLLSVKLTAPSGTACVEEIVQNVVSGRETSNVFELTPGVSQVLDVEGVPAGDIEITAIVTDTFSDESCTGDIIYEAISQRIRVNPGEHANVNQRFLARADLEIDGTFEDDIYESSACTSESTLVPREVLSMGPNGTGGQGLLANYTNGEVVEGEAPIWFGPHESGWVESWYPADQLADESAPALWETISGIGGETLTGYVQSPKTGSVNFHISCDDYCSIDIPGIASAVADNTGWVDALAQMEAGIWYPITLVYENRWGTNGFYFSWSCP